MKHTHSGGSCLLLHNIPQRRNRICGKGFYICRSAECLKKLEKDKRLRKNFSTKLSEEALLWLKEQLERQEANLTEPAAASCSEEVKDL